MEQNTVKQYLDNGLRDQCKEIIYATDWMDNYFKHEKNLDCLDFILESIGLELFAECITQFDEHALRFILEVYPYLNSFYFQNGETIIDRMYISPRTIIELNCEYTEAVLHNITTIESLDLILRHKQLDITKFKLDGGNYLHNLFCNNMSLDYEYKLIYNTCEYLCNNKPDEFMTMINEPNEHGDTPLFYLERHPLDKEYVYLSKIILLCKNNGANLLFENKGVTFLGISVETLYSIL